MRPIILPGALVRTAVILLLTSACAARTTPQQSAPLQSRDVLTTEDISGKGFATVLEALQALRPHWLQGRGPDSFRSPSEVKVFLDSNELGGVDQLGVVPLSSIVYIQHYNGIEATQRWGVGHGEGVIYLSTHPSTSHPI